MYASHEQTVQKLTSKISSFASMTGQERNKCGAYLEQKSKKYTFSKNDNFKHLKLLEVFPVSAFYSLKA
jgi:hypothetical protein